MQALRRGCYTGSARKAPIRANGQVIAFALESPRTIGRGGAKSLAAFERLIRDQGGDVHVNADVDRVLLDARGPRASLRRRRGVRPPRVLFARSAISSTAVCSPTRLPADIKQSVLQYRYGRAQVHYALKAPPKWKAPERRGADASDARARRRFESRQRAEARHAAGGADDLRWTAGGTRQTRCPEGKSILWLQLPEAPTSSRVTAGEIAVAADSKWTRPCVRGMPTASKRSSPRISTASTRM
jgi:phytoene dehydrogenase-like protein